MTDQVCLEIDNQRESWLWGLCKWCPTSPQSLRDAEKQIFAYLKSSYRCQSINIGSYVGDKDDNKIWTLISNEESNQTPLVMIHGFGSGMGLWCLNIDSVASNRPVYAFDILGFGRSSRPDFKADALDAERQFVSSIELWRANLNLEKFILLGHSFGGYLAASYAIKHPHRVSHLILADPWGFPEKPLDVANQYNLPFWVRVVGSLFQPFNPLFLIRTAGPLGPRLLQMARPDLVRKFSGVVSDAHISIPNYLYHCNAQHPSGEAAFHSMLSGFGWAKYPMIQRMDSLRKDVPITLVYGARSWVDRDPGFQIKYMRQQSYVNVKVIPAAGHHVYADRASAFNEIINTIGQHVDEGTNPPMEINLPKPKNPNGRNGNDPLRFLNVGNDRIRDGDEEAEDPDISPFDNRRNEGV